MRVETLTPEIPAVPGTTVECRLRVLNEAGGPAVLSVRIYGLGPDDARQVPGDPIPPGTACDLVVPLAIPETFSDGHHALAIEVRSDRQGEGVVLAPLTIRVASLDRVILRIVPGVLRGHRRQKFAVDVDNRRDDVVDLALEGVGTDLEVRLDPNRLHLEPNEKHRIEGRLRGPRHRTGDELQHVLTVSGRGAAVPSYATASYIQRPMFARGLRGLMAGLAILGLWAGIVGGGAYWFSQRGTAKKTAEQTKTGTSPTDTSATGAAVPGSSGSNSDGTGDSGGGAGDAAGAGGSVLPDGVQSGAPTATLVRGSVKAGATGKNGDVMVILTPLVDGQGQSTSVLGPGGSAGAGGAGGAGGSTGAAGSGGSGGSAGSTGAAGSGGPGDSTSATLPISRLLGTSAVGSDDQTKFWSARSGRYVGGDRLLGRVATLSVESKLSDADGAFSFGGVPLRRSYEVSFAKPGFDTQSFQISPPDDGKPVEMKVVLQPGKGALGGLVTGPGNQPLGGVKMSVTDGTLSFTTTSSTDAAGKGQWLIEGVSTPGTYTVIATLDGYGSQVAQVTLEPKQRTTDLKLTMTNGLGSISGVVRGNGGVLGGVTLTASNGTTTRTTTSFTAGATGAYLFPNIPLGTYTITATAPGYSTQTRLVNLQGNATGIDFEMVSTFATITGVVMSVDATGARPPAPLPNASIELSLGALKVRSTSAVAPDPGSFTLGSLPPGDYTVTFGRYDHTSESRPISLAAGQVLDLGQIMLTFTPRAQLTPEGSLTLTINKLINGSPVPLDLVSITLTDIAGRISIVNPAPGSVTGSFRYDKLPIGTYRLLVERDGYRPFTVPRINIGRVNVDQPVTMLKFGQAFGQVVDPLPVPVEPLKDYELLLYQDTHPGLLCKALLPVGPTEQLDGQGKIRWQVGVDLQLLTGDYVVRFRPAPGDTGTPCATGGRLPPGHADQPDPNGNVGTFTVAADNDNPIELADIPVYPYPIVRGLVLAPRYNAGTVSFVGLDALVAVDLAVTLDCGTGTLATAELTRAGSSTAFTFDRAKVASMFGQAPMPPGGVLPTCTVGATAKTFATVNAVLPTPLVIPTALPYEDRVVNIALVDDPDALLGTVYWKDPKNGRPIYVANASVDAPGAITSFGARQTTDPDGTGPLDPAAADPSQDTTNLHTTSATDGTGFWSFPGVRQVFGAATYTFTHPTTLTGSFELTITQSGVRTITATSGLDPTAPLVDDNNLDIVVVPRPGAITGSVSITTTRNPVPFGDARIRATAPGQTTAVDVPVQSTGTYTINPAAAGTWGLDLGSVPTANLVPDVGQPAQEVFVDAGNTAATALARRYVELGQITTEFIDGTNTPIQPYLDNSISYPQMHVNLSSGFFAPFPNWTNRTEFGDANGRATARLVSVSSVLPTFFPINYQVRYDLPLYELNRATWTVFSEANVPIATGTGTPIISASMFAGTRLRVVVKAPQFGSISGTVRGLLLRPPSVDLADVEPLDLANQLRVTRQQVQDAAGTQFPVPAAIVDATRVASTPPGFTFAVPAGFYLITYSHPDFVTRTRVVQVFEGAPTSASIDLDIARGSFELTVVTDEVSTAPVDGATVRLWPVGTAIGSIDTITPSYQGTLNASGFIDFDPATADGNTPGASVGIIPGTYLVVVRKADPLATGRDQNFPVIANVTVPRGPTDALRTVRKRAVMPRTDGGITGTVLATNGFRPVKLPPFTITRTFAVPQAAGPDALPNDATDGTQRRLAQQNRRPFPTPSGSSQGYSFAELAAGVHTLTFTTATGYTAPSPIPVTVDGATAATAPDVTYVANTVQVRITLTGLVAAASHPDVGVSLTSPAGGAALPGTEDPAASGTWVFDAVLPEQSNYTIAVTSTHYTVTNAADLSFEVPPSGVAVTHQVAVAAFTILSGTATKRLTPTTTGPVTEVNSVELVRASNGSVVATTTPTSLGAYTFNVTVVEALRVRVTVPLFKQAIVAVPAFSLAQSITVPTAFVDKFATAVITVAGAPVSTASIVPTPATGVTVTELPPGEFHIAGLDPAASYTFAISAPGFLTQTYPLTGSLTPAIGSNTVATVTLESPKSISGQTLKAGVGTLSQVSLFRGNTLIAGPTPTSATGVYSFTGLNYGNYTVSAAQPGVGAGELTSINVNAGSPSPTAQNVTLLARQLTVSFTITPSTAVPTITINDAVGTPGQTTFTFPEDGNLAFSITAPGFLADSGTVVITTWNGTDTVTVPRTLTAITVTGTVAGAGTNFSATVYLCAGTVTVEATCAASTTTATVAAAGGSFTFSPVVAGSYKAVAKNGAGGFTPLVAVDVTAAGVVTPSPLTLTFA